MKTKEELKQIHKELQVSEESKKLARIVIEKIAPNNNGIRAVNSGTFAAIEIIEEVFELK